LHPRPRPRGSWAATRSSLSLGKSLTTAYILDSTHTAASGSSSPPPPVVPPPELPPTHEVSLNVLAPTFVPKPPRHSSVEVTKSPPETDTEHDFEDLIAILSELSANGGTAPQFSTVFSLWRERKPDAIESLSAAKFKAYLQLAESAGIVAVQKCRDGDGCVAFCHQQNTDSNSSSQRTAPQQAGSRFRDLIQILNKLRLVGDPEPQFSVVGPRLLAKKPSIYRDAGVRKFEEYVRAAAEAGVVTVLGVKNGDGSLKLCPTYCGPPGCSSTRMLATGTPPTRTATTAFGTTVSGDALVSLRVGSLDGPSPPPQLCVSTPPLPSPPPPQENVVPSSSVNVTPTSFRALVAVLTELQTLTGESVFWFSSVAPLLLKRRPNAYASVGVTTFTEYVTLAVENGVASTGETEQGDGWVSLSDSMPGGPVVSPGPPNHRRMERSLLHPRLSA